MDGPFRVGDFRRVSVRDLNDRTWLDMSEEVDLVSFMDTLRLVWANGSPSKPIQNSHLDDFSRVEGDSDVVRAVQNVSVVDLRPSDWNEDSPGWLLALFPSWVDERDEVRLLWLDLSGIEIGDG